VLGLAAAEARIAELEAERDKARRKLARYYQGGQAASISLPTLQF